METIKLENIDQVPSDYTGIVIFNSGSKFWFKDGKRHRIGGPAVEYEDREKFWCTKEWWVDGGLHRIDGPAVEWKTGFVIWGVDGKEYDKEMLDGNLFLKKEIGKYGLEWIHVLGVGGIIEFPIIPGMETDEELWDWIKEICST